MKYETKPIDYTGCNSVIAEHLKRGEAIKCKVWDYSAACHLKFVLGFRGHEDCPYIVDLSGAYVGYRHAEPIPIKRKRIMPPERAIPKLIADGWYFTSNGILRDDRSMSLINNTKFWCFGKDEEILREQDIDINYFPASIIEEVE